MLITVSGMVGSGKTTIANQLVDLLGTRNQGAVRLRFQELACFALLRSPLRGRHGRSGSRVEETADTTVPERWKGYRRKRLGLDAALVYGARIVAFRVYRRYWKKGRVWILDRYFYDLFTHYSIETPVERFYLSALRALIPTPDAAIVLVADPYTIAERRPEYSIEYVSEVGKGYRELRAYFPLLLEIHTDSGADTYSQVEQIVAERLVKA